MKRIFISIVLLFIIFANSSQAQGADFVEMQFKAKVEKILEERNVDLEDGTVVKQQNLELKVLDGPEKDKIVKYEGINDLQVLEQNYYKVGDKVIAQKTGSEGEGQYFVLDYVRTQSLLYLLIIFVVLVLFLAKLKGLKALLSLAFTFLIIMYFLVPQILAGQNPFWFAILASMIIALIVIYLTEGFNRLSHLSVIAVFITLLITGLMSTWFGAWARLTGLASEDASFLIGLTQSPINFQGLLLAGIILGTLGVLDDLIISQMVTVQEIKKANAQLTWIEVYRRAMKVGVAHLSSMTNTLFLAYAGASLPLLLLFSLKREPFLSFSQVVNHELIATEIIRTLIGSICLVLAMPIATLLAARYLKSTHRH
jgi:uncharacterized membrane protein